MENSKIEYNLLQALKQVGNREIYYGSSEEYVYQMALWLYDEKTEKKEMLQIPDEECFGFVSMVIFNQLVNDTSKSIHINKNILLLLEKNKKFSKELEKLEKKFEKTPYVAPEKEYIIVKDENFTRFFMAEIVVEDSQEYGVYINSEDASHPMFHGVDLFANRTNGSVRKTNVIAKFKESEKENMLEKISELKKTLADIETETNKKISKLKNEIKELKHQDRLKKINAVTNLDTLSKNVPTM